MNLLFVHQNFPGQFRHLAPALAKAGHTVKAMGIDGAGLREIEMIRYRPSRSSSRGIHPWARISRPRSFVARHALPPPRGSRRAGSRPM